MSESTQDRRSFHATLIYVIGGLMSAALAIPASIYLMFPARGGRKSGWVEAGDLSQLQVDQPEELVFRRNRIDGWKTTSEKSTAWVVKKANNEVIAYAPQCTHLGCAYHWEAQQKGFMCPCHTSLFSVDGAVVSGPAPRPLDRLEVKVDGNKILIGEKAS